MRTLKIAQIGMGYAVVEIHEDKMKVLTRLYIRLGDARRTMRTLSLQYLGIHRDFVLPTQKEATEVSIKAEVPS